MKKLIKTQIDKHFNYIYITNIDTLESALPMLSFNVWLAYQKVSISTNNADQMLSFYIEYLNSYFLYLDHEFFKPFSSLKIAHYKIFLSSYYYDEFQKLHIKFISKVNNTKEMLIRTAVNEVDTLVDFYKKEIH